MLYGALHSPQPAGCHEGARWTRQIHQPLDWIMCFLAGHHNGLVRTMNVDRHFHRGRKFDIVTLASPWGLGGFIALDGVAVGYFAVRATPEDTVH